MGRTNIIWDDTQVILTGTFDGTTDVAWAKNGVWQATYVVNSSPYSFNVTGNIAAGDVITIYYNNNAAGTDSAYVTKATGASMSGLNLVANQVWVGNHGGAALTNADLDLFDNDGGGDDADIPFVVAGGNLTLDAGFQMVVAASQVYTPGGNITWSAANDANVVTANGALNLNANTITTGTALTVNSTGAFVLTTGAATFNRDSAACVVTVNGALDFGASGA